MEPNLIIPYSATAISIVARIIFMYLLYTKKSVNNLSLTFCLMNITSSSLWMKYSLETGDSPLILRSSVDVVLFFISASYIMHNKLTEAKKDTDNEPPLPENPTLIPQEDNSTTFTP